MNVRKISIICSGAFLLVAVVGFGAIRMGWWEKKNPPTSTPDTIQAVAAPVVVTPTTEADTTPAPPGFEYVTTAPATSTPPPPAPVSSDAPADQSKELIYVASGRSKVFHLPSCSWAKRISEGNLITFHSREEAIKAGLRPCKRCNP